MKKEKGQVMLLTTLVLSGTLLAATTLAGLLMVYQIRQSGNATQSTKAIFAADSGIEYELYRIYKDSCSEAPPATDNGTEIDTAVKYVDNPSGGQDLVIKSTGIANRSARAFTLNLGELDWTLCP